MNKYKNYMEIIAALLGVRLGEEFRVVTSSGEIMPNLYELTEHGLYRVGIRHKAEDNTLVNLLTGYETIHAVAAPKKAEFNGTSGQPWYNSSLPTTTIPDSITTYTEGSSIITIPDPKGEPHVYGLTIKAQGTGTKNEEPMRGGLALEDFYVKNKTMPSPGPSVLTPEQAELYVSMGGPYDKLCTIELKENINKVIELLKENMAAGKRALGNPIDEKAIFEDDEIEEPATYESGLECPVCLSGYVTKQYEKDKYGDELPYYRCAACNEEWINDSLFLKCPECKNSDIHDYYDSGHMIHCCEDCGNEWDKTLDEKFRNKALKVTIKNGNFTTASADYEPSGTTTSMRGTQCPACKSYLVETFGYANEHVNHLCNFCGNKWREPVYGI